MLQKRTGNPIFHVYTIFQHKVTFIINELILHIQLVQIESIRIQFGIWKRFLSHQDSWNKSNGDFGGNPSDVIIPTAIYQ